MKEKRKKQLSTLTWFSRFAARLMNFGEVLFRRSSVNVSSSLKNNLIVCFGFGAAIVVVVCVVVVVGCTAAVVVVWSIVVIVGSDGLIASGGKKTNR